MIRFSSTLAFQHDSIFSPFGSHEFDAAIDWAAASGLDGVELVISDYSNLPPPALEDLRRKLDARSLAVSTISTGGAYHREGLSLTAADESVRKKAAARVREHIDAAKMLGSKVTLGLLRGVGSQASLNEEKKRLAQQLAELDVYASQHKVTLLLEPINRYEVKLLNSLSDTVRFIDALKGTGSLKVLWDVFHANIEDLEFADEIARYAAHIGHVHLADNNRAFPGYGKFDFAGILSCLARNGFDGFASFECLNAPDVETVKRKVPDFLRQARKCQENNPGNEAR